MIALVRSVTAARTLSASRQKWSGSMSAKTGVAPVRATELAVAAKVNDGTITSSPGPTPAARRPRCSPEVPELTATHVRPEVTRPANSPSKAATSGPWAIMPDCMTASTAARSSAPTIGLAGGMKLSDIGLPFVWCRSVRGQAAQPGPDGRQEGVRHSGEIGGAVDEDGLEPGVVGGVDPEPVQPVGVETGRLRRHALADDVRRQVAGDRGLHADHAPGWHRPALMDHRAEPQVGAVLDRHVAGDDSGSGDGHLVADGDVVV